MKLAVSTVAALLLAVLLVASGGAQTAAPGQLQFGRLNRTYSDVITEIEPIRQGPVTVRLSSPRHQLTVRNHLLPKSVRVRIQSGVGSRIVGFCDRAAALLFSDVDCAVLNRALSTAVVPLPDPGESFLLENAELTAAERLRIDAYLAPEGR